MSSNRLDIFSIGQAARVLRVSEKTLRRWDKNGRLVAGRDKNGARVYTREQLYRFLENVEKVKYARTEKS
jgi:DNA-binding transcriptional MerR regulator